MQFYNKEYGNFGSACLHVKSISKSKSMIKVKRESGNLAQNISDDKKYKLFTLKNSGYKHNDIPNPG